MLELMTLVRVASLPGWLKWRPCRAVGRFSPTPRLFLPVSLSESGTMPGSCIFPPRSLRVYKGELGTLEILKSKWFGWSIARCLGPGRHVRGLGFHTLGTHYRALRKKAAYMICSL
ncbi:Hypothetical predicted protein [Marmota monax]|uniref:Uncharacterized protein n=1 Tax=Marmota monax TaxID=9995 RepID=A0A5E4BVN3_MARMO|nr:hypothetical protein GHT09_010408 [Marmota monax]VTJ73688.1 Hypothetical predicted protein [Marmota monax]